MTDLEQRLAQERPVPDPRYRGALGRYLGSERVAPRPARLRDVAVAALVAGAILLLVAVLGLLGAGPLAF